MTTLPTGTVTFLFTDIEGSTKLWEQHPEAMKAWWRARYPIAEQGVFRLEILRVLKPGLRKRFSACAQVMIFLRLA